MGRSSRFNAILCKGFIAIQNNYYSESLEYFSEAQRINSENKYVIFYKGCGLIMKIIDVLKISTVPFHTMKEYLLPVLNEFSNGIKYQARNDSFLRFYRGLIYLYLREFDQAEKDIRIAIKNTEDPNPKYYMYIGLTYTCMNMLKEAIKEISSAIRLNENYVEAYYNRGKCAYLLGDTDMAFDDFQKLLSLRPVINLKP